MTTLSPQVPFSVDSAPNTERLLIPSGLHPLNQQSLPAIGTRRASSRKPITYLPGEPSVSLDHDGISTFLEKELATPLLDELYPRLWLVARKCGNSIDSLHQQTIKGRKILPTEDPRLHLVWQRSIIYLKPIPPCLLNHQVWTLYLSHPPSLSSIETHVCRPSQGQHSSSIKLVSQYDRSVALGFLRSYAFLIQHHLDFVIAHQHHLIPKNVDWIIWSRFIACLRRFDDAEVAKRYHYGQLRLSRLHWAVRIFRPRLASNSWFYELPHWSTGPFLERALAPFFFIFASVALMLSAMQVMVSVPADGLQFSAVNESGLRIMRRAFWVFSIMVLMFSGVVWILLVIIPSYVLLSQLAWGYKYRGKRMDTYAGRGV
jgi:hypothetical protein